MEFSISVAFSVNYSKFNCCAVPNDTSWVSIGALIPPRNSCTDRYCGSFSPMLSKGFNDTLAFSDIVCVIFLDFLGVFGVDNMGKLLIFWGQLIPYCPCFRCYHAIQCDDAFVTESFTGLVSALFNL